MKSNHRLLVYSFFAIICAIPIFWNLGEMELQMWDESRNAVNAQEMLENGNILVRHFNGSPDIWETKPPLLVWSQAISIWLFGNNAFAVRLPSALAAIGTVLLIFWFFESEWKDMFGAVSAGLVLVTSEGYMTTHVARTGDHDAMLTFFLFATIFFVYRSVVHNNYRNLNPGIAILAVLLAFFTKSIVGLLFLPGIFLFILWGKKLKQVLTNKWFYLGICGFFGIICLYYFLAEQMNPGFVKLVWDNEYLPRYLNTSENYAYNKPDHPFYYLNIIAGESFSFWVYWIPVSFLLVFWKYGKAYRPFIFLALFVGVSFFIIISVGSVNRWYAAPLFPIMSMLVGMALSIIYHGILKALKGKPNLLRYPALLGLPLILFFLPVKSIFTYMDNLGGKDVSLRYGKCIEQLRQSNPEITSMDILHEHYNATAMFYQKGFEKDDNFNVNLLCQNYQHRVKLWEDCTLENVQDKSTVIACQTKMQNLLTETFEVTTISEYEMCKVFQIEKKKPDQ
ncbi:MAG: glycosyltransferase family 39 protein [Bacteroidota bacterium]